METVLVATVASSALLDVARRLDSDVREHQTGIIQADKKYI